MRKRKVQLVCRSCGAEGLAPEHRCSNCGSCASCCECDPAGSSELFDADELGLDPEYDDERTLPGRNF